MAINLSDNIQISAPKPTDSRYLNNLVPYSGVSQANNIIIGGVGGVRYTGLTVNIGGVEYWYKNGIGDGDLIIKSAGNGAGTLTGVTNGLSLVNSGTTVALGGILTGNTYINVGANTLIITGGTYNIGILINSGQTSIGTINGNSYINIGCDYINEHIEDVNYGTSLSVNSNTISLSSYDNTNLETDFNVNYNCARIISYDYSNDVCTRFSLDCGHIEISSYSGISSSINNNFSGITYAHDYSNKFTNRSLVDKEYVDTHSGGITGATNGLSVDLYNNVKLGGTLCEITVIEGANYCLAFGTSMCRTQGFDINTGGITIDAISNAVYRAGTTTDICSPTSIAICSTAINLTGTVTLQTTPTAGNISDSVIVWNSSDKQIKTVGGSNLGDKNNIYSTTTITGNTTLTTGSSYVILINHTGTLTLNLPVTPINGQAFKLKDVSGNALTYNITVNGNGNNIDGSGSALINTDYGAIELVYNTVLDAWFSLAFVN